MIVKSLVRQSCHARLDLASRVLLAEAAPPSGRDLDPSFRWDDTANRTRSRARCLVRDGWKNRTPTSDHRRKARRNAAANPPPMATSASFVKVETRAGASSSSVSGEGPCDKDSPRNAIWSTCARCKLAPLSSPLTVAVGWSGYFVSFLRDLGRRAVLERLAHHAQAAVSLRMRHAGEEEAGAQGSRKPVDQPLEGRALGLIGDDPTVGRR